ncbi:MAG TPA: acyl-CoA thioesterase [Polyangiaceae bacterium]|nr:acyl-CoA thioesterase [Polyangiaceae bacterium]
MPTASSEHEYPVLIVERHLDTFGHVNNATYLELFEEARWDLIVANGYGIEKIRETRKGPTILEVRLEFKRELLNRQRIVIRTRIESYSGKVGTLVQVMQNDAGDLFCVGTFLIGLFDLDARKLILPTSEWRKAVGLELSERP